MAKKEYLVIGSNNFWYASELESVEEALAEIEEIREHPGGYGNPEACDQCPDLPERFYIFEAREIKQV